MIFDKLKFGYPDVQDFVPKDLRQLMVKNEIELITSKDIEKIYHHLNEIIHTMTDTGSGLLQDLDEVRDELYALLR